MAVNRGIDRRTFVRGAGALGILAATGRPQRAARGAAAATRRRRRRLPPGRRNAVRGGSAVLATVDKPVNMDPADAQLYSSMQVYQNIFHKLVNVDADFKFIPGLASKWTQDDDKTWTLELVDNAVFHNGEPFTANDVKFSFDRLPEHAERDLRAGVEGDGGPRRPHRVRFHLSQPYGAVLATLAAIGDMVNEKAVTSADPKLKPVGTGPYQMTEWVKDDHITLERWDKFFKPDKPYLDEVVFRAIGDDDRPADRPPDRRAGLDPARSRPARGASSRDRASIAVVARASRTCPTWSCSTARSRRSTIRGCGRRWPG